MIYGLSSPRKDFEASDRLVRSVSVNSRTETRELRTVTSDKALLTREFQTYLENDPEALGVCFGQNEDKQFDIWISPSYRNTEAEFYKDTLLHELCHGYFGAYVHNYRWKRIFGRVLHQYNSLVSPIDVTTLTWSMLTRYTRQRSGETQAQYWERLENEQDSIAKTAVAELPYVSQTFDRLNRTNAV